MKSNTEFNRYKLKNDNLYLPLSGGKVNGETVFTKPVTFSSGDPKYDLVIKDKRSIAGESGKEYDLEFNQDLDELILTEDGADKTELHLASIYVGDSQTWESKTTAEKKEYKLAFFTDQKGTFSHVGQIIESTTLDTEAKVKAIYGSHTSWIQHTGYILRGATSNVTNNDNTGAGTGFGGADSQSISSVASHNHTQDSHNHTQDSHNHTQNAHYHNPASSGYNFVVVTSGSRDFSYGGGSLWAGQNSNTANATATNQAKTATNQAKTATNQAYGSTYSVPTLPHYKNVYIWERIA